MPGGLRALVAHQRQASVGALVLSKYVVAFVILNRSKLVILYRLDLAEHPPRRPGCLPWAPTVAAGLVLSLIPMRTLYCLTSAEHVPHASGVVVQSYVLGDCSV